MAELINIPSPGWPLLFGDEGHASIVLIHDSYGRLPYLESYAAALAKNGFFVVVPDLFNGFAATDDDGVAELWSHFDEGFALATLDDAISMGRGGDGARVGAIGLGFGGRMGLKAAQTGTLDAVVTYYAGLGDDEPGIIPCPVLLHLSQFDTWGTGGASDVFLSRLKEFGTPVTRHLYLGTSDGFANATISARLDRNAAALAFARSTYFLQEQLAQ